MPLQEEIKSAPQVILGWINDPSTRWKLLAAAAVPIVVIIALKIKLWKR